MSTLFTLMKTKKLSKKSKNTVILLIHTKLKKGIKSLNQLLWFNLFSLLKKFLNLKKLTEVIKALVLLELFNFYKKSTLLQCTLFFALKNRFFKIFSFAQNRFGFFDVDISTFVAPENSSKMSKNAIHVQQSRHNVKIAQNRFICFFLLTKLTNYAIIKITKNNNLWEIYIWNYFYFLSTLF